MFPPSKVKTTYRPMLTRDHTVVARELAAKGGADDDLNRLVNMGMVSGTGDSECTQFQSVSHKQRSVVVIKQTQAADHPLKMVHLNDPHHDSNKLYGVMKAVPLRELQRFELERLGIEERDLGCDQPQTLDKFCNNKLMPIACVGGAWLNDENHFAPAGGLPWQWPKGSRVALAARIADDSQEFAIVLFSAEEVFPKASEGSSLDQLQRIWNSVPSAQPLFQDTDMIVPILMPMRIANSNDVRFYG